MYTLTIVKNKKYYFKDGKRISIKDIPKDKIPNFSSEKKREEKTSSPIKISKQKEYADYLSALNTYILREVLKNLEPFEIKELCTVNKELNEKCKNEIIQKLLKEKKAARSYLKKVDDGVYIFDWKEFLCSKEYKKFKKVVYKFIKKIEQNVESFSDFLSYTTFYDSIKILVVEKSKTTKEEEELISKYLDLEILDTSSYINLEKQGNLKKNMIRDDMKPNFYMSYTSFYNYLKFNLNMNYGITMISKNTKLISSVKNRQKIGDYHNEELKKLFPAIFNI